MDERQRPSGLTELRSRLGPLPPQTTSRQELPINVPAKVIPFIVIAGLGLAACKPVNAGTTTPEASPTGTQAGEVLPANPTAAVVTEAPTKVPEVVAPNLINYTEDQPLIDAQYGDRYILKGTTLVPVGNASLGADAAEWAANAQNNAGLVAERTGSAPDLTMLFNNGLQEADSRNAAMSFEGNAIMWPTYTDGQSTFYSVSPSEFWFPVQVEGSKVTYTKVELPAGYTPQDVRMGWVGDNQSVELASKDGKGMIVIDPTTQEWREMKNIPSTELLTSVIAPFEHAFGDKVTVNGTEMDGTQLLAEIQKNPETFIQKKTIAGTEYSFFIINNKILALQDTEGQWQESTMGSLGKILGIPIGSENRLTENFFSQLTAATVNAEWSYINPKEGEYDWNRLDTQIQALIEGGMAADQITLHGMVFDQPAQWVIDRNPNPDELTTILETYVTDMVKYGKSHGIETYTLITEPYFAVGDQVVRPDYFYEKLGDKYYEIVFSAARKADPDAYLILNDTANHFSLKSGGVIDKTNAWYVSYHIAEELCKIKVDGKPILNAVGFEMHNFDMNWFSGGVPTHKDIEETMSYFKTLGVDIVVTEFDYDMSKFSGTEEEKQQRQEKLYYDQLSAALDAGVKKITFWDISDESTWLMDDGIMDGMSTPFDQNDQPKRAYYGAIQAFSEDIMKN